VAESSRFSILTVCTANICRSPLIELLLTARLDTPRFEVASAGVLGFSEKPMDTMSAMEALRLGLDPFAFRSRALTPELLGMASLILTATRDHRAEVLEMNPQALRRTFSLTEFAQLVDAVEGENIAELVRAASSRRGVVQHAPDLPDPYGRSPDVHRKTATMIEGAVDVISLRLNALPTGEVVPAH
jgi:protein-tyrosine phosphatase